MIKVRVGKRQGVVVVLVVIALLALLGLAALTIDVGQLCIAAQIAQDTADAAALAGGTELPDYGAAMAVAVSLVEANNQATSALQASCDAGDDIAFWGPGETIPDFGPLGGATWGIEVLTHVPVEYAFARVLGLSGASRDIARHPLGILHRRK